MSGPNSKRFELWYKAERTAGDLLRWYRGMDRVRRALVSAGALALLVGLVLLLSAETADASDSTNLYEGDGFLGPNRVTDSMWRAQTFFVDTQTGTAAVKLPATTPESSGGTHGNLVLELVQFERYNPDPALDGPGVVLASATRDTSTLFLGLPHNQTDHEAASWSQFSFGSTVTLNPGWYGLVLYKESAFDRIVYWGGNCEVPPEAPPYAHGEAWSSFDGGSTWNASDASFEVNSGWNCDLAFAVVDADPVSSGVLTSYDHSDTWGGTYGPTWEAQQFTTTSTSTFTKVEVKLHGIGAYASRTIGAEIRTDNGTVPSSTVLCSGSVSTDVVTDTSLPGTFYEITLGAGCEDRAAGEYWLVHNCPACTNSTNRVRWDRSSDGGGLYSGGNFAISSNSGSTWSDQPASQPRDHSFKVHGLSPAPAVPDATPEPTPTPQPTPTAGSETVGGLFDFIFSGDQTNDEVDSPTELVTNPVWWVQWLGFDAQDVAARWLVGFAFVALAGVVFALLRSPATVLIAVLFVVAIGLSERGLFPTWVPVMLTLVGGLFWWSRRREGSF